MRFWKPRRQWFWFRGITMADVRRDLLAWACSRFGGQRRKGRSTATEMREAFGFERLAERAAPAKSF